MRFPADMGVSQRVVSWLRNEGHDALHVREENLLRLPNGLIFEKAYSEKRILLTFQGIVPNSKTSYLRLMKIKINTRQKNNFLTNLPEGLRGALC